jgi:hypothetical protein
MTEDLSTGVKSTDNVEVLIVVDVENALQSDNLGENLYMIDNHRYCGSYNIGTHELTTAIKNGRHINWRVCGITPSDNVEIHHFAGNLDQVCKPKFMDDSDDPHWAGSISAPPGSLGKYWYKMGIQFNKGKILEFDPFIQLIKS